MIKYLEKEEDFKTLTEKRVLVDFYAEWCGPCRMMAEVLDDLNKEDESVNILKIDTDKFADMSFKMGVMTIPTLVIMEDNKEIKKHIGYMSLEELKDFMK